MLQIYKETNNMHCTNIITMNKYVFDQRHDSYGTMARILSCISISDLYYE